MAIDSEDKRRSATQMPWFIITHEPDGAIDEAIERAHITGMYEGIAPAAPAVGKAQQSRNGLLLGVY